MKRITTDKEAIKLIEFLYQGGPETEEEWEDLENLLDEYQSGVSCAMRSQKVLLSPEEVLRIAREKNKPIIL